MGRNDIWKFKINLKESKVDPYLDLAQVDAWTQTSDLFCFDLSPPSDYWVYIFYAPWPICFSLHSNMLHKNIKFLIEGVRQHRGRGGGGGWLGQNKIYPKYIQIQNISIYYKISICFWLSLSRLSWKPSRAPFGFTFSKKCRFKKIAWFWQRWPELDVSSLPKHFCLLLQTSAIFVKFSSIAIFIPTTQLATENLWEDYTSFQFLMNAMKTINCQMSTKCLQNSWKKPKIP